MWNVELESAPEDWGEGVRGNASARPVRAPRQASSDTGERLFFTHELQQPE